MIRDAIIFISFAALFVMFLYPWCCLTNLNDLFGIKSNIRQVANEIKGLSKEVGKLRIEITKQNVDDGK